MEACDAPHSVDIYIAGVGGQGALMVAEILGKAAIKADKGCLVSEIHGMAQRGGVVVSTVRIGENIHSPLVRKHEAHVVLAFEPVEAYRALELASKDTLCITSINEIPPPNVLLGTATYPPVEKLYEGLEAVCGRVVKLDSAALADEAGSSVTANIVMLGALAGTGKIPFDVAILKETMLETVPAKFREINEKAFDLGFAQTNQ